MANSRRGFRPRSPRRLTGWEGGPQNSGTNITTNTAQVGTVGAQVISDGLTLIRTRGFFAVYAVAVSAISSGWLGAVAIGITSLEAFNAGIASLRSPLTDADSDSWLWHQFFDVRAITATISDGANGDALVFKTDVDSKAMRKLTEDDVIYVIIDQVEEGVSTLRWQFDSRILVKLP